MPFHRGTDRGSERCRHLLKVAQLGRSRAEWHTGVPLCHTHCLFAGHLSWGGEALAHLGLGRGHILPHQSERPLPDKVQPLAVSGIGWTLGRWDRGVPQGRDSDSFWEDAPSRWQVLGKLGRPRRPRGWEGVEWWPQRYVHTPAPDPANVTLFGKAISAAAIR